MNTKKIIMLLAFTVAFTGQAFAAEEWITKAPMPTARFDLHAAPIGGLLYVAGGHDGSAATNKLEVYNPATNAWAAKAPMLGAVYMGSAGVIDNRLYVAGGWNWPISAIPTRGLQIYDPATDSWSNGADMPILSGCSVAGAVDRKLYVLTACDGFSGFRKYLHAYDPDSNTWVEKAQAPNIHAEGAGGVINGKFYVVGGFDGSSVSAALDVYDPATDTWTAKAPMPNARRSMTAGVINGKLYVVGGSDITGTYAVLDVYDPATNTWATSTPMLTARSSLAAGVINAKLYAAGGSADNQALPKLEAFPEQLASMPTIISISVPANPLWTDTGLTVSNGDTVTITASGTWNYGAGPLGPDGYLPCCNWDLFMANPPALQGELIAFVGPDPYQGHWGDGSFFPRTTGYWDIGSSGSFISSTGGKLWLGFNDDAVSRAVGDNSGSVTASIAVGKANGIIAGTVTSASSGSPVAGATVAADSSTATTDAQGYYSISIAPGTYTVTASETGFVSSTAGVTAAAGATVTQNFALQQAPALTSIAVSPATASVASGSTQTFTAAPKDQFGNPIIATVTWSSSDTTVGTISSSGVFTALKAGTTKITATSGQVSGSASATVTAVPTPVITTPAPKVTTTTPAPTVTTPAPTPTRVSTPTKFRVAPTAVLRPVSDVIEREQDGIVELYMDNPSLNDVTLKVEARVNVPSGIHVYGQSFGQAGAAGMVMGSFEIPPGTARTIAIVIKADKTARIGSHAVQFVGLYYPGENKDYYQPISLTYPLTVKQASKNPEDPEPSQGVPEGAEPPETPGFGIVLTIVGIFVIARLLRRDT